MIAARRALLALVLLTGLAGAFPATTAAWSPRPLPGHTPAFVTETDVRPPWTDCLWASAAMLLDKWTAGRTQVGHAALRTLAREGRREAKDGSNLADLKAAFDRLGQPLTYSPDGGEIITWKKLLKRLQAGGGAILLGDYSKLPKHYGRWDPSFWAQTDDLDNHAVYLDRYDRRHDRIWVMDPLAPAGWRGEWIPRKALVAYAWRTAFGALYGAMTPAASPDPFHGVTLGDPSATVAPGSLSLAWPVEHTPKAWKLPGVTVDATVTPLDGSMPASAEILVVPPPSEASVAVDRQPAPAAEVAPAVTVNGPALGTAITLPTEPGGYQVTVTIRDDRFGDEVATAGPYAVYVPGDRTVAWDLDASPRTVSVGGAVELDGTLSNTGAASWAEPDGGDSVPPTELPLRQTAVWAHWVLLDDGSDAPATESEVAAAASSSSSDAADASAGRPTPIRVRSLELEPGESAEIVASIVAPSIPGRWLLVLDLEDAAGSFAAAGSPPFTAIVKVAEVRAPEPQ